MCNSQHDVLVTIAPARGGCGSAYPMYHIRAWSRDWDLAGLLEGEWEATFWIALGAVVREGWEERGRGLLGSGVPVSLVLDDSVLPSCLSQSCHVHINTCVSRLWFCLILFLTDGEEMPARALTYADFILHGCFLGQVHLTAYCVECFCSFSKPGVNCSRVWMPHALIVLVRRLLLCQENVYLYCWLLQTLALDFHCELTRLASLWVHCFLFKFLTALFFPKHQLVSSWRWLAFPSVPTSVPFLKSHRQTALGTWKLGLACTCLCRDGQLHVSFLSSSYIRDQEVKGQEPVKHRRYPFILHPSSLKHQMAGSGRRICLNRISAGHGHLCLF